jgi:beta-lactamase regulating signal transducer with metallopeptidase domain
MSGTFDSVLRWGPGAGRDLAEWAAWMTVWTAGLLVVCVALDRLLARRVSASWRIALYGVIALRLALPLSWASPVTLVGGGAPAAEHSAMTAAVSNAPALSDVPSAGELGRTSARGEQGAASTTAVAPSWPVVVLVGYAVGVVALSLVVAGRMRGVRRVAMGARAWDGGAGVGGGRNPRVLVHPSAGPMLIGVLRPRVIVPRSLVGDGGGAELRAVLAHERAHVRRGDHVLAPVLSAASVALWPILPVWIAAARVRGLMEQAADELATRGADGPTRLEYGRALVTMARDARRRAVLARLAPAAPLGFTDGLEARVRALAGARRWGRWWQAGVVVAASAAMIACAGSRADAQQAKEPPLPEALRTGAAGARDAGGARIVRMTVLSGVPKHPKIPDTRMAQEQAKAPEPQREGGAAPARVPTLSADEAIDVLRAAAAQGIQEVLSPSAQVTPGQVQTGTQDLTLPVMVNGARVERPVVAEFSSAAGPGPDGDAGGATVEVRYRETMDGRDVVWGSSGPVELAHGRTAWTLAHGEKGAPMRLVLYTVEPAPGPGAAFDPTDPSVYPLASTMVWMFELAKPVAFDTLVPGARRAERGDGVVTFAGEPRSTAVTVSDDAAGRAGAWACVMPEARLSELGDALRVAGGRHMASPAIIGALNAPLTVGPGARDKAHSSTGVFGITLKTGAGTGGVVLDGVQVATQPDGTVRRVTSIANVRLAQGEVLAVLQPPAVEGGSWLVTVYNPSVVSQVKEYPFQRSDGP